MHFSDVYRRDTYHFSIPEAAIAQKPLAKRDESKLLQRQRTGAVTHHHFFDLAKILPERALLVVNESKVIPARLYGKKDSGAGIEVFLLEELVSTPETSVWSCLARPMKKLHIGTSVYFAGGVVATVVSEPNASANQVLPVQLSFPLGTRDFYRWLDDHAKMPLPPYIKRQKEREDSDKIDQDRYQTIYGDKQGSVAAPTAGLHFTPDVMADLNQRGITITKVCLHVGAGTFLPVKADDIRDHQMHEERFEVAATTFHTWLRAKEEGRPIIAVGTTSFRVIEGLNELAKGRVARMHDLCGETLRTNIFIHPKEGQERYKSWLCDGIITNFHQPESSLFMLVCALIGVQNAKDLYAEALAKSYRFYSYGDASLLWL